MARHTLRIDYDDATGAVALKHACFVDVNGQPIRTEVAVEVVDGADELAAFLKRVVDDSRAELEAEAGAMAVRHAAATAGKAQPGVKRVKVGGVLRSGGGAAAEKKL